MPGEIIDRAYVAIEPTFKDFGAQTKAGISKSMGGVSTSVKSTLGGVEKDAGGFGKRIGKSLSGGIKSAFDAVGGKKLVGLLAVGGIIEGGKKAIDTFESVTKESLGLQRVMGGTVKSASEWRGAMQLGGLSNQQFMTSVRVMSKQVTAAASGKSSAFGALGISVKDAQGKMKGMGDLLPQISDKFKTMAPGAAKNALAIQLFGRSGLQMLPFLNRGSAGMEELKKKADSLGIVIGDKQAAQFKKSVVAQRELKAGVQGLQIWFGERLVPALDHVFEIMNTKVIPAFHSILVAIKPAIDVLKTVVGWVSRNKAAMDILVGALAVVTALWVANWVRMKLIALTSAVQMAAAWLIAMGPIALIVAAVIGLVVVIVKNWTTIKNFTLAVWGAIVGFVRDHWKLIVLILTGGLGALVIFIVTHWTAIVNFIKGVWTTVVNWIRTHWRLIVTILTAGLIALIILVVSKWTTIKNTIVNAVNDVVKFIAGMPAKIKAVFLLALTWLVQSGRNVIGGLRNGIVALWGDLSKWLGGMKTRILAIFVNVLSWLYQTGRNVLGGLRDGIVAVWDDVSKWLGGMKDRVVGGFVKEIDWLYDTGKNILKGLWNGIKALGSWLVTQIKSIIPGWIKSALGINSIPQWAVDLGTWIAKGLAKGITKVPHFMGNLAKMARDKLKLTAAQNAAGDLGKMLGGATNIGVPSGGIGAWIFKAMGLAGVNAGWFAPLARRIMFESGGHPNAINLTDSNAQRGTPSIGLMQVIKPTFDAFHMPGYDNIWDPVSNILAAIRYIISRYGSIGAIDPPIKGYAQGAWRIPADQLAFLHRGESVAPAAVAEKWRQSGGPGGAVDAAAIGLAVAAALAGAEFRFDADGIARLVTRQQAARSAKGVRR